MKRRTLLLAVGGTSAVGTGAVSELTAERGITVAASSDNNAIVKLEPRPTATDILDELVTTKNGEVKLTITELSGSNGGVGKGVNSDAVTAFDDLLKVTNQSVTDVDIRFTPFETGNITAEFFTGNTGGSDPRTTDGVTVHSGSENELSIKSGNSESLGVLIDTNGFGTVTNNPDSVTVTAAVAVDAK